MDKSFRKTEELALIILVLCLTINYNTFATTLIGFFPLLMLCYLAQTLGSESFLFDSRTSEKMTNNEIQEVKLEYALRVFAICLIFVIHHYMMFLDLSKFIIEKHMTAR